MQLGWGYPQLLLCKANDFAVRDRPPVSDRAGAELIEQMSLSDKQAKICHSRRGKETTERLPLTLLLPVFFYYDQSVWKHCYASKSC